MKSALLLIVGSVVALMIGALFVTEAVLRAKQRKRRRQPRPKIFDEIL